MNVETIAPTSIRWSNPMMACFPEKSRNAVHPARGLFRFWLPVLSCLAGVAMAAHASAASTSIATFLSPHVAGMSLAELRKRAGGMECAIGSDGAQDCFVTLPFGVADHAGSNEEARVFVRARGGRFGQVIVNGPIGHLTRVLDMLSRHNGSPTPSVSRASAFVSPCNDLSQWQRDGHSVVVRTCRNPLSKSGGGEFVVNLLADWYVFSREGR